MEKIYCIPGLGLNYKVFKKLQIPEAELIYLDWIVPKNEEDMASYAKRFSNKIKEESFSILGMSLGGMMAIEIARIKQVKHLYLISTVKNKDEMPSYLRWMDKLPSQKPSALKFALEMTTVLKPLYDNASKEGNLLFQEMVKEANPDFVYWGIKEVAKWSFNESITTPFTHIHGTDDLVFPIKNIDEAITVKGGTHFMIFNDAERVSSLIRKHLSNT